MKCRFIRDSFADPVGRQLSCRSVAVSPSIVQIAI